MSNGAFALGGLSGFLDIGSSGFSLFFCSHDSLLIQ